MRPRVCPRDGAEGEDDREGDADEARDDASSRASSRIVAREDPSNTGGGKVSSGANDEPRRDVIEEASEPGELREHRTCERGAREECPEGTGERARAEVHVRKNRLHRTRTRKRQL